MMRTVKSGLSLLLALILLLGSGAVLSQGDDQSSTVEPTEVNVSTLETTTQTPALTPEIPSETPTPTPEIPSETPTPTPEIPNETATPTPELSDDMDGSESDEEQPDEDEPTETQTTMPESTPAPEVERSVSLRRVMSDIIRDGDAFSIEATLVGFDDIEYELKWQYNDGQGWQDVADANGSILTVVANENNVNYDWRILISIF